MVRVFKNGRMMFKHKNKSFSFPETLFIYYLKKIFFFFGGGDIGGCPKAEAPRSQLCPGSLAGESPEGPTKAAWPAGSRDGCPWAHSRQLLCPDPQGGWTNLGRRSGHREGRCQMCSCVGGG